jgi:hypothetical protein
MNDSRTTTPIIVVGTGRSGTSTVAGMLVDLGVDMGTRFRADLSNPDGFFEDWEIKAINQGRLDGHSSAAWEEQLATACATRAKPGKPWGWKDPRTAEFMGDVVRLFPNARYVRCNRDRFETLASFQRWYGMHAFDAATIIDRRTYNLDRYLPIDTIVVSIPELRSDPDKVANRLKGILREAGVP